MQVTLINKEHINLNYYQYLSVYGERLSETQKQLSRRIICIHLILISNNSHSFHFFFLYLSIIFVFCFSFYLSPSFIPFIPKMRCMNIIIHYHIEWYIRSIKASLFSLINCTCKHLRKQTTTVGQTWIFLPVILVVIYKKCKLISTSKHFL